MSKLMKPTGPYLVGHYDLECKNPIESGCSECDTILTRIYYPSDEKHEPSLNHDNWIISGDYLEGYGHYYNINLPDFIIKTFLKLAIGSPKIQSTYGFPITSKTNLPVVIFSHGLAGNRTTYSTICIEYASQGYIVFAIEHRDGSASMTMVNGKQFRFKRVGTNDNDDFELRNKQLEIRTSEVLSLIKILKSLNDGEDDLNLLNNLPNVNISNFKIVANDFLKNKIDLNQIILTGHSFGGSTVINSSQKLEIDAIKSIISYDPWMHPITKSSIQTPTRAIPTLIVATSEFPTEASLNVFKEYLKKLTQIDTNQTNGKFVLIQLKNTLHLHHSDLPSILSNFLLKPKIKDPITHDKAIKLNRSLSYTFLGNFGLLTENSKTEASTEIEDSDDYTILFKS